MCKAIFSGSQALISSVSCLGTKNSVLGEVHFLWTMSKALMEQGRQENCLVHHLFIPNEWERKNAARQSRWSLRERFLMRGVRNKLSRRVIESPPSEACRRCWICVILLQWKAEGCNCTGLREKGRKLNYRSAETVVMKTFQKHHWAWEPWQCADSSGWI